jgi:hypothetical protein
VLLSSKPHKICPLSEYMFLLCNIKTYKSLFYFHSVVLFTTIAQY